MKKIFLFLVIISLSFIANASAIGPAIIGTAGKTSSTETFIHTNGLEAQADDADWTDITGTPDYDYSAAPLVGLESLALDPTEASQIELTDADDVYWSMAIKWDGPLDANETTINIYNSVGTGIGNVVIDSNGKAKVLASGGTQSGASATSLDDGSTHYILLRFRIGTGADAKLDYWHWNGSAWDDTIASTDGTSTTQASKFRLTDAADTEILYVDQIKEKATSINSPL